MSFSPISGRNLLESPSTSPESAQNAENALMECKKEKEAISQMLQRERQISEFRRRANEIKEHQISALLARTGVNPALLETPKALYGRPSLADIPVSPPTQGLNSEKTKADVGVQTIGECLEKLKHDLAKTMKISEEREKVLKEEIFSLRTNQKSKVNRDLTQTIASNMSIAGRVVYLSPHGFTDQLAIDCETLQKEKFQPETVRRKYLSSCFIQESVAKISLEDLKSEQNLRIEEDEEVEPQEEHEEVKLQEEHEEVKPQEEHEEVKPQEEHEEVKPQEEHEEVKLQEEQGLEPQHLEANKELKKAKDSGEEPRQEETKEKIELGKEEIISTNAKRTRKTRNMVKESQKKNAELENSEPKISEAKEGGFVSNEENLEISKPKAKASKAKRKTRKGDSSVEEIECEQNKSLDKSDNSLSEKTTMNKSSRAKKLEKQEETVSPKESLAAAEKKRGKAKASSKKKDLVHLPRRSPRL
eukprot:GHVP01014142.1.p2 GENE.GHVP01014142.1~~GHVP01014142.1.p2  ORF type:complete len:475 (+),score=144.42 GHVP01014142.1:3806-5230(+)